jgi:hypothetical protein
MNRLQIFAALLATAVAAATLTAQTTSYPLTDGTSIQLPDLTITGSTVNCDLMYDASRGVYRYSYTLNAPVANLAPVLEVKIDLSGKVARPQLDPTLAENINRYSIVPQATTVPVGLTVPDLTQWGASGVSAGGRAFFRAKSNYGLLPGSSKSGFVLESRQGPGIRRAWISPSIHAWWDALAKLPKSNAEFVTPLSEGTFAIETTTVGPADLTDADLFDGGSQSAEVDNFLRYASPLQSRTKVPANTNYIVIVYYGKTIIPSTFSAMLDRADVTSRFHPVPGGADAITIKIGTSTTKHHLSVVGTKLSGGTGTDSDTLTFIPQ